GKVSPLDLVLEEQGRDVRTTACLLEVPARMGRVVLAVAGRNDCQLLLVEGGREGHRPNVPVGEHANAAATPNVLLEHGERRISGGALDPGVVPLIAGLRPRRVSRS